MLVLVIIAVFTGDGSSNTMAYFITGVYAGVSNYCCITGDGSSNTMTYFIAGVCAGVSNYCCILQVVEAVTQ